MSNGQGTLVRRSIAERTTTTILRQRHTATAVAGATAQSVLVGPPSGKEWLIVDAVCSPQFVTNPGGMDSGDARGEIIGGGPDITFVGETLPDSQGARFGQLPPGTTLEFGDEVRINVDASNSAQNIDGTLTFWGFEYDAI